MRAQVLDDLLHIFQLLGGEERVVQKLVVCFTVLVLGAEQIDCRIQQFQHVRTKFEIEYGTSIEDFLDSVYLAGADLA